MYIKEFKATWRWAGSRLDVVMTPDGHFDANGLSGHVKELKLVGQIGEAADRFTRRSGNAAFELFTKSLPHELVAGIGISKPNQYGGAAAHLIVRAKLTVAPTVD